MEEFEKPEDVGKGPAGKVRRWMKEIKQSESHEKDWRERAQKVVKRYRDDDRNADTRASRFNILYANTEVLKGVMYQRTPIPDVRRRFLDKDPISRQAAQILQRALSFTVDAYDFDGVMNSCVEDVLLPGRATPIVKYIPTMGMVDVSQPDGIVTREERVIFEEVKCEYVDWKFFRISSSRRWERVRWIAFGELMTREDLIKNFGEKLGNECKLNWAPKDKEDDSDEFFKRALIWKVWDKRTKKVLSLCEGLKTGPLAEIDDPLGLEGFFPIPKPLLSVFTNDSLIPVPEFVQYQDQAEELDEITGRIDVLVSALKRRGVYDAAYEELSKLANAGDNEFIPVEKFAAISEKGGLDKAIWEQPIEMLAKVLIGLYDQRDRVIEIIHQITGIADIIRGSTDPNETLGAQKIKSRFANVRIFPRQKSIEKLARDLFRMKAEIMSEKFSPETLKLMTGEQMWQIEQPVPGPDGQAVMQMADITDQIMKILRSDKLRGFKVDIETDSTVQPDAHEEKEARVELLTAIGNFVTGIGPAVQAGGFPQELAKELLAFGVRGFKTSPQIEELLDSLSEPSQQDNGPKAEELAQKEQELQQRELQVQDAEQKFQEFEKQAIEKKAQQDVRDVQQNARDEVAQKVSEVEGLRKKVEEEGHSQDTIIKVKTLLANHESSMKALLDKVVVQQAKTDRQSEKEEDRAKTKESSDSFQAVAKAISESHAQVMEQVAQLMSAVLRDRENIGVRGKDGRLERTISRVLN